ncbi:dienelactone hydrolase family protein [Pendulispora brunnea]|uniref:Dienelactone hydrolase family protein n=1 Tax=Pendulispora brunnea TaxID=2905690 RepID=A0ABZ2KHT2_9BACT
MQPTVRTPGDKRPETKQLVTIRAGMALLEGELAVPQAPHGLVFFAHGSGSSRHSPRNRIVAQALRNDAQVATLLFDLLSPDEEQIDVRTGRMRFDIDLLARRLIVATDWARGRREGERIGYFGASTGAAAALLAAAVRPNDVAAVVSRGGRPDLAGFALDRVRAPTLLIVGGEDYPVIDMNREAMAHLQHVETRLDVIPRATHLFEEPGALGEVARRAAEWFRRHMMPKQ